MRCVGMCVVWVCVGVLLVFCWCVWLYVLACVVVCGCDVSQTLSRSRYTYTIRCTCRRHSFAHFIAKKKKQQSRTLAFHDVCFSKPLTFHNVFMFFFSYTAQHSTTQNTPHMSKRREARKMKEKSSQCRRRLSALELHCVNTISVHREKKKTPRPGRLVAHVSTHTLTFHDYHYPSHLWFSLLCSRIFVLPGGRQKVKLIDIPAAEQTIQRHFASAACIAVWVFREVSVEIVLARAQYHFCSRLHW